MLSWPIATQAAEPQAPQMQVKLVPKTYNGGYHLTCFGTHDGSIQTVVTDGEAPYTYVWSTGATTETLDNVGAGIYTVTVTGAYGATATATIELLGPKLLEVEAAAKLLEGGTHISKAGGSDGSAWAEVSGGTPPYEYLWSTTNGTPDANGSTKENLEGLTAGTYTVTVTDVNGCTVTSSVTLTEPTPLTASLSATTYGGGYHVSCAKGEDGAINLTVNGGIAPYKYNWSSGHFTEDVTGLKAGYHEVRVTDANGAEISVGETLTEPQPITIELTSPLFGNGYHVSCHSCYNGTVNSNVSGGVSPYTYSWATSTGSGQAANGPITATTTVENAGEKEYGLQITDANGCEVRESIELKIPERDDWTMNGNAGVGPDQFIGTTDATDLVLKANNQPQLRLGADGVSEVYGELKVNSLVNSSAYLQHVVVDPATGLIGFGEPYVPNDEPEYGCWGGGNSVPLQVMGNWSYDLNEIYSCPQINVGIGTDEPLAKLDVRGETYVEALRVNTLVQTAAFTLNAGIWQKAIDIRDDVGNLTLSVSATGKTRIGPTHVANGPHADYMLSLDGKLVAKEIVVTTEASYWADFVFSDNYCLDDLAYIKEFVKTFRHLPGVPSEKEIKEQGQDLARTNAILLQKIEELYLHVITLNEKVEELTRTSER